MNRCRSCGAPVVWVETEASATKPGRRMPLDADAAGAAVVVDGGNIDYTGRFNPDGTRIVRYVEHGHHRSHSPRARTRSSTGRPGRRRRPMACRPRPT